MAQIIKQMNANKRLLKYWKLLLAWLRLIYRPHLYLFNSLKHAILPDINSISLIDNRTKKRKVEAKNDDNENSVVSQKQKQKRKTKEAEDETNEKEIVAAANAKRV